MEISELEFNLLRKYLHSTCGIDVPWEKRYLFETRLTKLIHELDLRSFSQLYRNLTSNRDARTHGLLVEAMTTNETGFFRDGHPFDTLKRVILPNLAEAKLSSGLKLARRIRVASVGCSTGEEPYSLAITLQDWAKKTPFKETDLNVLALDISRVVLDVARRGVYPRKRVEDAIPRYLIEEYFEKREESYRVGSILRSSVTFSELNLSDGIEHLGFFDVIFCRNVIIYFTTELKVSILGSFHRMLHPEGVLILGASEALYQFSNRFKTMHFGPTTYYIRK